MRREVPRNAKVTVADFVFASAATLDRCASDLALSAVAADICREMGAVGILARDLIGQPDPERSVVFGTSAARAAFDHVMASLRDSDPTGMYLRRDARVVSLEEVARALDKDTGAEFRARLAAYGIRDFILVPVMRGGVVEGGVSFLFPGPIEDDARRIAAAHLGGGIFAAAERLAARRARRPAAARLTARELECLRWCANGRTSWEIGLILGIGERTVHVHLQRATKKLDALSRIHAVAQALRLNLIA